MQFVVVVGLYLRLPRFCNLQWRPIARLRRRKAVAFISALFRKAK